MPIDPGVVIPWEPMNIPMAIQDEFNRRKKNRSLRYVQSTQGNWDSQTGDWSKYRGPMVPWVRLCSNSKGAKGSVGKEGFVLFGGKGFYNDYGFTAAKNNPSVIGYIPNGQNSTHVINNDINEQYPIHVPAPEIEKINVSIQKELYRRAEIEWVCFSKKQLEYMTPYFLVPGISAIMEWGWNHYNPVSLIDLSDTSKLQDYFNNPYPLYTQNIIKSRGNYDVIFGIITNFEWTVDGNKFRCKTEITSKDRIYSGLIVDSTTMDKTGTGNGASVTGEDAETNDKPFDSLSKFIDSSFDLFRNVVSQKPDSIDKLSELCAYVRNAHPKNADEYLYGVFDGRDPKDLKNKFAAGANKDYDFDCLNKNSELWVNLGLVIEVINFHAKLNATKGKEMFRVDIDDVVVGAHPNMISSDGSICLIPNWESPHYFYGQYGLRSAIRGDTSGVGQPINPPISFPPKHSDAITARKAADWRLSRICGQLGKAYRDDVDQIINAVRYENGIPVGTCCFPFKAPTVGLNNNPYPQHFSGYLKNIYVNISYLKSLLSNSSDITTYFKLVEKLAEDINGACGSFWDLRLVSAPGDSKIANTDAAPMKLIDYKFMSFSNRGKVWAFDYFDADSLLLGIGFKPTLSNAQAIRTIYSPTNNPDKTTTLTNGDNELLDYGAEDRLNLGQSVGNAPTLRADTSGFDDTMRQLQQGDSPADGSYQITSNGIMYRLALPSDTVQQLLLDDSDEDNNPKYTGIMPGIQATFTIQGVGGLRTFMMFLCKNLPNPYSENNIVFRIVNLEENVEPGNWTTTITAGVIPLRGFIKSRLGISP